LEAPGKLSIIAAPETTDDEPPRPSLSILSFCDYHELSFIALLSFITASFSRA